MDAKNNLQAQTSVADVLKNLPNAYVVFANRKTNCIGCFLQKFCTLEDVASSYQIQDLVNDLEKFVSKNTKMQRSIS